VAVTALTLVFLLITVPLFAQTGATLQGHVVDMSGATIPRVAITLRGRSINFDLPVHTDARGRYLISLMFQPPLASIQEFNVDNSAFSVESMRAISLKAWF
jgi:hypothetical protein